MPRTGTTSLAKALRALQYKVIHAPLSIIKRRDQELLLSVEAARRYEAMADLPVALMYKQLDAAFPDSKFILTIRDVEKWILSMRRVRRVYPILRLHPIVPHLIRSAFGEGLLDDEEAMRVAFLRHTKEVLTHFEGRDNLLVLDFAAGDGWKKLCGFLNRPVPDTPFPHSNRKTLLTWSNFWDTLRGFV